MGNGCGDVFDGVLFCADLSPTRCLGLDIGLLGIFLSTLSYTMPSKLVYLDIITVIMWRLIRVYIIC